MNKVPDLLNEGVCPTVIQQLTGHKNVQSISNYAVADINIAKHAIFLLPSLPKVQTMTMYVGLLQGVHKKT